MIAGGSDPAAGAEGRHADHVGGDQGGHRERVQDRDLPEQRVVIDQAGDPHGEECRQNPDHLFPPGVGVAGVVRGAENLQNAQAADGGDQDQHQPIEIAK